MIVSGLLLLVAVSGSWFGTGVLSRADWPRRAPALGIVAWQCLSVSIALSLILSGLTLLVPAPHLLGDVAGFLLACVTEFHSQYPPTKISVLSVIAGAGAVGLFGRVIWALTAETVRIRRHRNAHRAIVDLVGRPVPSTGVVMLEHPVPMVYCLPGRRRRVVVTRAASRMLSSEQLSCVLAHERAHLRARHDLALAASEALRRAFFDRRVFRTAAERIGALVEMHADDGVGRDRDRRIALAGALVCLAGARSPAGALGAGGASALARVNRLSRPVRPLLLPERTRIVLGFAGILVAPAIFALGPATAGLLACWGAAPLSA